MCKPTTKSFNAQGVALPSKSEVKASIPAHLFQHSYVRAFSSLARDLTFCALLAAAARLALDVDAPTLSLDGALWHVYGFWQGVVGTGLWVLAHECGHGGFTASELVNDLVGYPIHTLLLVPYFSWQYSHAKHHAKTNHMLDGESHVPPTLRGVKRTYGTMHKIFGDTGFGLFQLTTHLLLGWPMYLITGETGARRTVRDKKSTKGILHDHFRPSSPLFPEKWKARAAASTAGILAVLGGLAWAASTFGLTAVWRFYGLPYLHVNAWLVLYTWLQHTSPDVPHFGEDEWTWLKGALCTIDRPYGIFDYFHHYIGSTHVCHHLFSNLPAYNATEATAHLKAYLEPMGLYNYDPAPISAAAWKVSTTCHGMESCAGEVYYKSINDSLPKKVN